MLDIPGMAYFKAGNAWCADHKNVRCRIIKIDDELIVYIWPDPWCFDKTDKEKISEKHFAFTKDGLTGAVEYANAQLFTQ